MCQCEHLFCTALSYVVVWGDGVDVACVCVCVCLFFFQAEDGIRDLVRSRGLGDVYKRQIQSIAGYRKKHFLTVTGERLLQSLTSFSENIRATPWNDLHQLSDSGLLMLSNFGKYFYIRPGHEPVSYTHLTLPTSDLV